MGVWCCQYVALISGGALGMPRYGLIVADASFYKSNNCIMADSSLRISILPMSHIHCRSQLSLLRFILYLAKLCSHLQSNPAIEQSFIICKTHVCIGIVGIKRCSSVHGDCRMTTVPRSNRIVLSTTMCGQLRERQSPNLDLEDAVEYATNQPFQNIGLGESP